MTISGVTIISNPELYPLSAVLESMLPVCDEILINVDNSNETALPQVEQILESLESEKIKIVPSTWNWNAKDKGQELARQTNLVVDKTKGQWIICLQADEMLHPDEHKILLQFINECGPYTSGFETDRLYFYGRPDVLRLDWTTPLTRIFRKGSHRSAGDAMNTERLWGDMLYTNAIKIYHYSRIGDPKLMVTRIMSLSRLFHEPDTLHPPDIYDFTPYKYDSFSTDNPPDTVDPDEVLMPFTGTHPAAIIKWYKARGLWPE